MNLKNLNELFVSAKSRIESNMSIYNEFSISDEFVAEFKTSLKDGEQFIRGQHVSILKDERYSKFIPHQWFKLAVECADFFIELNRYKEIFNTIYTSSSERSDVAKDLRDNPQNLDQHLDRIKSTLTNEGDVELFSKFLTDYSWFNGKKTIDRGDFWFTPILNLGGLLHTDGSTFGDVCIQFAQNSRLKDLLMSESNNQSTGLVLTGDRRSLVKQLVNHLIQDFGIEVFRSTLNSSDDVTFKTIDPVINLIKAFDTIQTKDDLTTSGTLRYFEEYIAEVDSKYWYLTTQWTDNGGTNRDFNQFVTYVQKNFPSVLLNVSETSVTYSRSTDTSSVVADGNGINLIVYGAPGTGKSYYLENKYPNCIRTVFHGEYSNADFVGSVRPTMDYESGDPKVVYDFIPGPFALAIKQAASSKAHTSLLIEEINRGDAANIFGEIFQLLDRNSEGESEYSISVSLPFEKWLIENCPGALIDKKLRIPSNLSIVATMNSADQGVQTMDSAFKRRWRFLYMPVKFDGSSVSNMKISYQNQALDWKDFAGGINKVLEKDVIVQEDRLIGPYFLRKEEISSKDSISEKLLLYLWDDVLRISGRDIVFDENITSFFEVQEHYKNGKSIFSETVHEAMGLTDTDEQ